MTEIQEQDRAMFADMAAQAVVEGAKSGRTLQRLVEAMTDEIKLMDMRELAFIAGGERKGAVTLLYSALAQGELERRMRL